MKGKVFIFSAPSGAGKTTIVKHILNAIPGLEFSISATNRPPREGEINGRDYFFLTEEEFCAKIKQNEFVEYEEVYPGRFYGTLKSEIERIWNKENHVVFDVDVKGGINLKKIFGRQALSVFVSPPDIQTLKERLLKRGTESCENISVRVQKAQEEMSYSDQFDEILFNDNINETLVKAEVLVNDFLK